MAKFDLVFSPPVMNAPGSLGFAPDRRSPVEWDQMGFFVTNPVSLLPRKPAQGVRYITYPGGFLLHSGHPNPGLKATLRKYAPRWERSELPIIVNLLCRTVREIDEMVRRIEGVPGVQGVEVSLPPGSDGDQARLFSRSASGELPVVMRLPFNHALEIASALIGTDVAACSLAPPRGVLADSGGGYVEGRLYGPGLFPLVFGAVRELVRLGIPVIAGGGVYTRNQVEALVDAGALGVQLDSVLWRGGWWKGTVQRD